MALLAAITALAPFSLQIFLPALPAIQASFAVGSVVAGAQPVDPRQCGGQSGVWTLVRPAGRRRPVLLVGLTAFIAGSLGCALAPSIELLIGARRAVDRRGAGMVLARAIVRDVQRAVVAIIAYLTMAMVVAPMLAPTIGAVLLDVAGWRAIFVLATGIGGAQLADPRTSRRTLAEARRIGNARRRGTCSLGQFWSYVLSVRHLGVLRVHLRRAVLHDERARAAGDRIRLVVHPGVRGVHGRQSGRRALLRADRPGPHGARGRAARADRRRTGAGAADRRRVDPACCSAR